MSKTPGTSEDDLLATRRQLIRGAAAIGALAYVAPQIATISARPAFAAASPTPTQVPTPAATHTPLPEANPCCPLCRKGKPHVLTMRYTGQEAVQNHSQAPDKVSVTGDPAFATPVRIIAADKSNPSDPHAKVWFDGIVHLNGEFDINSANGGQTRLSADTWVLIYPAAGGPPSTPLQTIKFHTSCSQPLNISDQFGSLVLTHFLADSGLTEEDECPPCSYGKLAVLTMRYTGEGEVQHHSQDAGKVSVSGNPAFASPVRIIATDKSDPSDPNAKKWFDGTLGLNGLFDMRAANAGATRLGTDTWVFIYVSGGGPPSAPLQTVKFHTSCSQPLNLGDQFGSLVFEHYVTDSGVSDTGPCPPCVTGKPKVLTMEYTGEGTVQIHNQDAGKVSVTGDPAFATPVRIIATDRSNPLDSKAKIWFDGTVSLNGMLDIDATNAGATKLSADTWVFIYPAQGGPPATPLQTVKFHTSCSQPLAVGDQYGSLRLAGYTPQ